MPGRLAAGPAAASCGAGASRHTVQPLPLARGAAARVRRAEPGLRGLAVPLVGTRPAVTPRPQPAAARRLGEGGGAAPFGRRDVQQQREEARAPLAQVEITVRHVLLARVVADHLQQLGAAARGPQEGGAAARGGAEGRQLAEQQPQPPREGRALGEQLGRRGGAAGAEGRRRGDAPQPLGKAGGARTRPAARPPGPPECIIPATP